MAQNIYFYESHHPIYISHLCFRNTYYNIKRIVYKSKECQKWHSVDTYDYEKKFLITMSGVFFVLGCFAKNPNQRPNQSR